jgi:hypothetical protein
MSEILTSTLRDAAESALDKGFSVFPLKPRSKQPATTHGFKDASALPAQIDTWWTEIPDANVGVACGESNLIVLDFDNGSLPEGFEFPETFTVKTSRGLHLYYWGKCRTADMHDASGKHIGEIKSLGGYVLAAGSVHPDGPIYTAIKDVDVAEAPKELLERLVKKPASDSGPVSVVGDKIPYGQHDNELHRIAGRLRHDGLEEEAIFNALVEVCEKRCEGYGSDYQEMCRKHADSICEKPVGTGLTLTIGGKDPETGIQVSEPRPVTVPSVDPSQWPKQFKGVDELEDGDVRMLIKRFLPEGTIFFGGLSGKGKTWIALSIVKALTTGKPFVNTFDVPETIPVMYLIPESSSRAFKSRLKKFGIPSDRKRFICRTLSEGATPRLDDPYVREAVKQIKPIVVLDTAIRFSTASDENAAMQNKALADAIVALRQAGAVAVIGLHHSTKASAGEKPSLENTLRGTGDLGAMCDAVYCVEQEELDGAITMKLTCVKPRDFDPPLPFKLIAKARENGALVSKFDTIGDFEMVDYFREVDDRNTALAQAIVENPTVNVEALSVRLRIDKNKITGLARNLGWEKATNRAPWTRIAA